MAIDIGRIEAAVAEILAAIGEDPARDGLRRTPERVAATAVELFAGIGVDPAEPLLQAQGFDGRAAGDAETGRDSPGERLGDLVALRGIAFRSVCEHHLLPFHGTASIVYRPADRIVGLGSLARVVEIAAARPQLQERLTEQIADALETGLRPRGALVVLEAVHGCVSDRGPRQERAQTMTLAARGDFAEPVGRAEAIALLGTGATA